MLMTNIYVHRCLRDFDVDDDCVPHILFLFRAKNVLMKKGTKGRDLEVAGRLR